MKTVLNNASVSNQKSPPKRPPHINNLGTPAWGILNAETKTDNQKYPKQKNYKPLTEEKNGE